MIVCVLDIIYQVSIAPFLLGEEELEDKPVFLYRGNLLYAVRQGQYKVNRYSADA